MNGLAKSVYICVAAFTLAFSIPGYAIEFSGKARVIDGDTLSIGSQIIRLYGIDAPENGQDCQNARGELYNCGVMAENALKAAAIGRVVCKGTDFDAYERLIAVCTAAGVNINQYMVRSGYAMAYRKYSVRYVTDEEFAVQSGLGLWAGRFDKPWEFRAIQWKNAAANSPSSECPIKGNINLDGERIYHTPWSRSYARTKIDTSKSERWFCSETEALEAGWRAPLR